MKIFFFDGNCEFCSNLASKLRNLCLNREIQFFSFRNFSNKELLQFHPELKEEILHANVQFIYNKKRFPGFFAVRKLAPYLKGYRYFFWILYLPLIPLIGILIMHLLKKKTHNPKDN